MLKLSGHHIGCFGEVVWDDFPDGKRPGGSPGNFAYHCQQLSNKVSFISRVGADSDGNDLISFLKERGLPIDLIQVDKNNPTGKVLVHGTPDAPHYTIVENSAWDNMDFSIDVKNTLSTVDAFCFATLIQRNASSAGALYEAIDSLKPNCFKVLDINLRPPFYSAESILKSLERATLIKMNDEELDVVSKLLDQENLLDWIFNSFRVKLICITKGESGAMLTDGNNSWSQDAFLRPNSDGDTVGVGDAFLAALCSSLLNSYSYQDCLDFASRYASEVAVYKGAMPDINWPPQ